MLKNPTKRGQPLTFDNKLLMLSIITLMEPPIFAVMEPV